MRHELVNHRGLRLVDALQRDLPALGADAKSIARVISPSRATWINAPSSVTASSASSAPFGGPP